MVNIKSASVIVTRGHSDSAISYDIDLGILIYPVSAQEGVKFSKMHTAPPCVTTCTVEYNGDRMGQKYKARGRLYVKKD